MWCEPFTDYYIHSSPLNVWRPLTPTSKKLLVSLLVTNKLQTTVLSLCFYFLFTRALNMGKNLLLDILEIRCSHQLHLAYPSDILLQYHLQAALADLCILPPPSAVPFSSGTCSFTWDPCKAAEAGAFLWRGTILFLNLEGRALLCS